MSANSGLILFPKYFNRLRKKEGMGFMDITKFYGLKKFIYHHDLSAKLYNIYRNYKKDKKNYLTDEQFAKQMYQNQRKMELNLNNPVSYDEKVWYLKLHEKDELKKRCTDKVTVREYVKECGLEHILNEIYGVYNSFEEIPFSRLPDTMFVKCSHTSGCNVIYRKDNFDYKYYKHEFEFWMKRDYYWGSREWNYRGIVPKIICEKVLRDREGKLPLDYKFFCFNGCVKFMSLDIGVAEESGEHAEEYYRNLYDTEFKLMPVRETRDNYLGEITKPDNFELMIDYANKLSKPFKHCRVDFYNLGGKIYFGEITFHHGGGVNHFIPDEWENIIGSWINISEKQFTQ